MYYFGFNDLKRHEDTRGERLTDFFSPVNHVPGHGQHASHPAAAHHPATHKEGGDVDRFGTIF